MRRYTQMWMARRACFDCSCLCVLAQESELLSALAQCKNTISWGLLIFIA